MKKHDGEESYLNSNYQRCLYHSNRWCCFINDVCGLIVSSIVTSSTYVTFVYPNIWMLSSMNETEPPRPTLTLLHGHLCAYEPGIQKYLCPCNLHLRKNPEVSTSCSHASSPLRTNKRESLSLSLSVIAPDDTSGIICKKMTYPYLIISIQKELIN